MCSHSKKSQSWIIIMCLVLVFSFSMASCNRGDNLDTEADSSEAEEEPIDPADPTVILEESVQTATEQPATPTKTEAFEATVNVRSLRVREGPGTDTFVIAGLQYGNLITLIGRNGDGTWVKFDQGWVAAEFLLTEGEIYLLPIITGDLDTLFTSTPRPTRTFTPTLTPSYTLTLINTPTATRTPVSSATITSTISVESLPSATPEN